MNQRELIRAYLRSLEKVDCEEILNLFMDNATVSSPLYSEVEAARFYKELFEDTSDSKIDLYSIFVDVSNPNRYALDIR